MGSRLVVVGTGLALAVAATVAPAAGGGAAAAAEPARRVHRGELTVGGSVRTYRVYVPDRGDRRGRPPVVLVLHGGFGNGAGAARQGNWDAAARSTGSSPSTPTD